MKSPYTADDLRKLSEQLEVTGEDSRLQATLVSILDRLERLESHENAFYREPKEIAIHNPGEFPTTFTTAREDPGNK